MEYIELLKKNIDSFNKYPDNLKSDFIDNIKNNYKGYEDIIELFPKLKKKDIDKFIKVINDKVKKQYSRQQILQFYSIHTCLVEFLLDKLNIICEDSDEIDNNDYEWRNNQLKGINSSIDSNFVSGIHSQATGSGKSLMALKIMWEYHKMYPTHNLLWLCERKDIPQKLFFNVEYKNGKIIKVINKQKEFNFWKANDIIDMSKFEIKEYVYNKSKQWINELNQKYDKPLFIIINRAFMTTASSKKNKKYRYQEINNISQFIILDECHSSMASRTYELLTYCKYTWKSKIHGLSATPYRKGKSNTEFKVEIDHNKDIDLETRDNEIKLKNIFHKPSNINELNIISWFNLKEAIEEECILEPVFHWFDIDAYHGKKKLTSEELENEDEKETNSVLQVLNEIISDASNDTYYNMKYRKIIVWCKYTSITDKWFKIFKKKKHLYENLTELETFIDYSNVEEKHKPIKLENGEIKNYYYDDFYDKPNNCIMFCAAKFREGSDIPNLSCALFLDKVKNRGELPFIQCIGRVLRKAEGKNCGHILDGYVESNDEVNTKSILDKLLKYYLHLYEISKSDFVIDEQNNIEIQSKNKIQLYEEIKNGLKVCPDEKKIYIEIKNNKKITINLENIKMKTIKWSKIIPNFKKLLKKTIIFSDYDEFMLLKNKVQEIGIKDKKEYLQKTKDYKTLNNITNPEKKYKEYWTNWYDFLGIDTSEFIQKKDEWKKYCLSKDFNSVDDYYKLCENNNKLPTMPEDFYNKFTDIKSELNFNNPDKSIIITPVSSNSISNYNYEKQFFNKNKVIWTGTKYKNEIINNRFAFCNNKKNIMEIFIITKIKDKYKKYKRECWNEFPNKNVIFLTNKIATIKFTDYKKYFNYSSKLMIQGTSKYKWNDKIMNMDVLNKVKLQNPLEEKISTNENTLIDTESDTNEELNNNDSLIELDHKEEYNDLIDNIEITSQHSIINTLPKKIKPLIVSDDDTEIKSNKVKKNKVKIININLLNR